MKCYACRKEIEEGRERCSACGFPVIYIVDEKDAENIRKMADDYRQSKLEGVSIELTAYQYAIENDELVLSEERSMPLFKGSQLNFDTPVWFEQDFAQIDTDEPLTLNITVAAEGKKTTHALSVKAPKIDGFWHIGAVLDDGFTVRMALGNGQKMEMSESFSLI